MYFAVGRFDVVAPVRPGVNQSFALVLTQAFRTHEGLGELLLPDMLLFDMPRQRLAMAKGAAT